MPLIAQLALSMGEKLLSMHMTDSNKAKTIAETLNKSFYHHGYPLGRTEAKKIGLPITNPDTELEELLWDIYESFETEMKFNEPFDPLKLILNSPASASLLAPTRQVQIPGNLPQELLQQVYDALLAQIQIVQIVPVDYELLQASTESEFGKSEYKTACKIFANKLPDNNITMNIIQTASGWHFS
jgi:hypothetical protein